MKIITSTALGLTFGLISTLALALPLNGTGNVTPDVIFGSGNANGSFTGVNENGVELGLRGKLRYNLAGNPENTFNYDGDRTYTFDPINSNAPANRSIFNFEFSINSDSDGSLNRNLNALTYRLDVDIDPSAAINNAFSGDPINVFYADHSLGNNSTANGQGIEAYNFFFLSNYSTLTSKNNVAQNSINLGFNGYTSTPQALGIYTFSLSAFDGDNLLASTSIDVIIGEPTPNSIPVPATLPLLIGGLGLLAFMRRRQG